MKPLSEVRPHIGQGQIVRGSLMHGAKRCNINLLQIEFGNGRQQCELRCAPGAMDLWKGHLVPIATLGKLFAGQGAAAAHIYAW